MFVSYDFRNLHIILFRLHIVVKISASKAIRLRNILKNSQENVTLISNFQVPFEIRHVGTIPFFV